MRRGQEQEDLQPGRAQRYRDDHHREQAQAARAHDPRPHRRRHVAAEAHQHHHEAAAVEPELRHQRVGEERRARQVPGVLDDGHEQEEQDDQRHERRHRREAAPDAVEEEAARHLRQSGERRYEGRAPEPVEARRQRVLDRLAQREDALEHEQHQRKEQRQAQPRVQQQPVDAVGQVLGQPLGDVHRGGERRGGLRLQAVVLGEPLAHGLRVGPWRAGQRLRQRGHRLALTVPVFRRHQQRRHADRRAERRRVDADAELLRLVGHVEQHHDRDAEAADLQREPELAVDLRRVQHQGDEVDARLLEELPDEPLVAGKTVQVVDARQVDDLDHVGAQQHLGREELDGDPGPVAHARRRAGDTVEERRLAGVRHADQRDALHGRPAVSARLRSARPGGDGG